MIPENVGTSHSTDGFPRSSSLLSDSKRQQQRFYQLFVGANRLWPIGIRGLSIEFHENVESRERMTTVPRSPVSRDADGSSTGVQSETAESQKVVAWSVRERHSSTPEKNEHLDYVRELDVRVVVIPIFS